MLPPSLISFTSTASLFATFGYRACPRQIARPGHQLGRPRDHCGQQRTPATVDTNHPRRARRAIGSQFTDWLSTEYPSLWQSFSGDPAAVDAWPTGLGSQIAENGSDGVMTFVGSPAGNGSITYDEYSYALARSYPVANQEAAGYFTTPAPDDVRHLADSSPDQHRHRVAGLSGARASPTSILTTTHAPTRCRRTRTWSSRPAPGTSP